MLFLRAILLSQRILSLRTTLGILEFVFILIDVFIFTLGGRVKQVQPFKGFGPFDLGGEFIHGSNTVVNRIALDNGWLVLPVSKY